MTLPNVIGPINPNGNTLSGIINEIKNKYGFKDPISSKFVIPNSSYVNPGNVETVVLWNANTFRTRLKSSEDVFVELWFPNRYLYITAYSLQGISDNTIYYQKEWKVEGYNQGEENVRSKWVLLAENTSSQGDFCGTGAYCSGKKIATFTTKKVNKGFQYIRFTGTQNSYEDGFLTFAASAIDVYGTLTSKYKKLCSQRVCVNYRSKTLLLFMLFAIKS